MIWLTVVCIALVSGIAISAILVTSRTCSQANAEVVRLARTAMESGRVAIPEMPEPKEPGPTRWELEQKRRMAMSRQEMMDGE